MQRCFQLGAAPCADACWTVVGASKGILPLQTWEADGPRQVTSQNNSALHPLPGWLKEGKPKAEQQTRQRVPQ